MTIATRYDLEMAIQPYKLIIKCILTYPETRNCEVEVVFKSNWYNRWIMEKRMRKAFKELSPNFAIDIIPVIFKLDTK